jgi:hypothetical protein
MRNVAVFLGHDSFGTDHTRRTQYRVAIAKACDQANQDPLVRRKRLRFIVVYWDTELGELLELFRRRRRFWRGRREKKFRSDARFWMHIRLVITECDYVLFDLTYRDNSSPFNSNVLLEYGLAIGLKKKVHCFGTSRDNFNKYLRDQAGYDFPQYATLNELTAVVRTLLILYLYAKPQ